MEMSRMGGSPSLGQQKSMTFLRVFIPESNESPSLQSFDFSQLSQSEFTHVFQEDISSEVHNLIVILMVWAYLLLFGNVRKFCQV